MPEIVHITTTGKHPLVDKVRYGVVHMKEGFTTFANNWITSIAGQIILVDHALLGIEKPGDTSWAVWVCDPDDHDVGMVIPGCQIRAVALMAEPPKDGHQQCLVYG